MPERVERIIQETTASLCSSLTHYWPAAHGKEIGEANPILHLGHVLAREGFAVLGEVPESRGGRVDLVAIRSDRSVGLVAEGKRLFNAGKAWSMAADFERLESISLIDEYDYLTAHDAFFGVLRATTWGARIAEWWRNPERGPKPTGCRAEDGWQALAAALGRCERVGSVRVWGDDSEYVQSVLYAVKALPGGPKGFKSA